jgi:hypothetical protein
MRPGIIAIAPSLARLRVGSPFPLCSESQSANLIILANFGNLQPRSTNRLIDLIDRSTRSSLDHLSII